MDKRYLDVLASRGVPVVPLRQIPRGSSESLRAVLDAGGWTDAVVKPAVSGGGWRTWRTRGGRDDEARFAEQLAMADCLVQPFVPEVVAAGEWSLVFSTGASAMRWSRPASRLPVQEQFGGTTAESKAR